jgi:hypothetical protein
LVALILAISGHDVSCSVGSPSPGLEGPLEGRHRPFLFWSPCTKPSNVGFSTSRALRSLAGELPKGLSIHHLRHTCASLLIREGASVKAVQEQLGHSSPTVTLGVYAHLFDDDLDHLFERVDSVFTRSAAPPPRPQDNSTTDDALQGRLGKCLLTRSLLGAPGGIRTPDPRIRSATGHFLDHRRKSPFLQVNTGVWVSRSWTHLAPFRTTSVGFWLDDQKSARFSSRDHRDATLGFRVGTGDPRVFYPRGTRFPRNRRVRGMTCWTGVGRLFLITNPTRGPLGAGRGGGRRMPLQTLRPSPSGRVC